MIYLKNTREKQTVYIPRTEINSKVVVVKGYDEGYADGIEEGKNLQKKKLTNLTVSENGVYNREDGWNKIDVNVPSQTLNLQEKNITITKDIEEVIPDDGYDALTKVDIDAREFGNQKHFEGYNEGYNAGKVDGVNLVPFISEPSWEKRDENNCINEKASDYAADGFSSLTIDISTIYSEGYEEGYADGKSACEDIGNVLKVRDTGIKFGHSTFAEIPENIDFEGVDDFIGMFDNCENLKSVRSIDTSSATDMSSMFYNCGNLETISQLDTSNVTNMANMFAFCYNLKSIPPLNAENVTFTAAIFMGDDFLNLTDFGGFGNLKANCDISNLSNLSRDSCLNILKGLYDFIGNGETPAGNQGTLYVHPNFVNTVGSSTIMNYERSKGWIIITQ